MIFEGLLRAPLFCYVLTSVLDPSLFHHRRSMITVQKRVLSKDDVNATEFRGMSPEEKAFVFKLIKEGKLKPIFTLPASMA